MGDQGPVFFFKPDDKDHGWLSQWYWSPFTAEVDGKTLEFKHAEQYMMYRKALTFNDQKTAHEIMLKTSPRVCKALGQAVKGFDDKVWDQHKRGIVVEGSYCKFTRGTGEEAEELKKKFLATGERELVEASPHDRIWGIGFSRDRAKRGRKAGAHRDQWGQNILGKCLQFARRSIRDEETEKENKLAAAVKQAAKKKAEEEAAMLAAAVEALRVDDAEQKD